MKTVLLPLAFGLGLIISLQLAMNAATAAQVQNLRLNNAVFWITGGLTGLLIGLGSWDPAFMQQARAIPLWLWLGGALGAGIVIVIAWLILQLGTGTTNVLMLAGQVVGGVLIAHFGLLGSPHVPLNSVRIVGILLMLAGALLAVVGRLPGRVGGP